MSLRGNGRRSTCLGGPKFTTDNVGQRTQTMEEQKQQEKPKEPTLAELAERIAKLEAYIATQSVPTFSDIYEFLAATLKKAQRYEAEASAKATAAHEAQIAYLREAHQQFVDNFRVLAQNLEDQVREIRKKFDERIQQEIVRVTS